jgi:hypothetical protein
MHMIFRTALVITTAASLSACTGFDVFKDSSSQPVQGIAPQPLPTPAPINPVPSTALSATQIKSLLAGKSWSWAGPKNSGVTLYASDGTSLVQVTGKGTTGGKWSVRDGQLCESFNPAPFIPQGVPNTCQTFSGAAGTYRVGQATFKLAS